MTRQLYSEQTGEEVEVSDSFTNTGVQPLIPAGTEVLVAIASSEWVAAKEYANGDVNPGGIKISLHVLSRGPYKDFMVNDNLKMFDDDSKKAKKAETKLMTYDRLCKGLLAKAKAAGRDIIDDDSLLERALNGGELLATFYVWELTGNDGVQRSGNWIRSIGPKPKHLQAENKAIERKAKSQPPVQAANTAPEPAIDDEFDDDIPF